MARKVMFVVFVMFAFGMCWISGFNHGWDSHHYVVARDGGNPK